MGYRSSPFLDNQYDSRLLWAKSGIFNVDHFASIIDNNEGINKRIISFESEGYTLNNSFKDYVGILTSEDFISSFKSLTFEEEICFIPAIIYTVDPTITEYGLDLIESYQVNLNSLNTLTFNE